jgi:hypothetical protein
MSTTPIRRTAGVLAAFGALALLASCASGPQTTPTELPAASDAPSSPAPTATPTETAAPAADPTCETIVPESVVAEFGEIGWTAKSEPMRVGSTELAEGIMCTWGDYSVATDHVQIYGWAPLNDDQREEAIAELIASGWTREDDDAGVYVTESSDTAIATDAEGYGLTYLFGDGSVTYADTKQGLVLVEWPPA